ncbi:hypothetical protein H9L21_01660 [Aeromicrobium senzhongii]|uniref:PsbP C-terminal domain-containing protein n=1 Tax=Aeromicrobium senzhongii TaxID=2663859 RepID=A0ABX6STV8_9ACTN|nr:hypothetical protein [Aeromicrobium senzhongii]MTB88322.1 hypothetical protein [Aeromicrobium senzhongii]QNL94702.1 hypothetical protein H9L21_01660 [Aeromicrobium senzhongii]
MILMAALAAGCGGGDGDASSSSKPDSSSSESPAITTGQEVSGTGYTFRAPEGWGDPPQEVPGMQLDSLVVDLGDDDGFNDNLNVLLSPAGPMKASQAETAGKNELTGIGASDVKVHDRTEVAGRETAHLSAGMSLNDAVYEIDQYYIAGEDQTYVATFSFSKTASADQRQAAIDHVLNSWSWAD